MTGAEDDAPPFISRQVLREFLVTLTRASSYHEPIPIGAAVAAIRNCEERFRVVEDDAAVTARLLALVEQVPTGGRQIHDANIVATVLAHDVRRLLTDNVADFARFAGLIEGVPLVRS